MSLIQKKYKRLLSELVYVNSEYQHVKDILNHAHNDFEEFYQSYCRDYNVPIDSLNKKHADKIKKIFPKKKVPVDSSGIVKQHKTKSSQIKPDKTLQKMYRKAAILTHPDKFAESSSDAALNASETFKRLTTAFNEKKWADFLDICEKLDILPTTYKKVFEIMRKEISLIKTEINKLKQSYSWKLFECDDDTNCKIKVIKGFLHQIFGYEKK